MSTTRIISNACTASDSSAGISDLCHGLHGVGCGRPALPHDRDSLCCDCAVVRDRHNVASTVSATSTSHVTHYASGDTYARSDRAQGICQCSKHCACPSNVCRCRTSKGCLCPTTAVKAGETRRKYAHDLAGSTVSAIAATSARTSRKVSRRSSKGRTTTFNRPGTDSPVSAAYTHEYRSTDLLAADRDRQDTIANAGHTADLLVLQAQGADPQWSHTEAQTAYDRACKRTLAVVRKQVKAGAPSALLYRAKVRLRATATIRIAAATHARAMAASGDLHKSAMAVESRLRSIALSLDGTAVPLGGRASLADGRIGSPWHAGRTSVCHAPWLDSTGQQCACAQCTGHLVGSERTKGAGQCAGSKSKRDKARSQIRVSRSSDYAIKIAEYGSVIESIRTLAAKLSDTTCAHAIAIDHMEALQAQGATRKARANVRAKIHTLGQLTERLASELDHACQVAGMDPIRVLAGITGTASSVDSKLQCDSL